MKLSVRLLSMLAIAAFMFSKPLFCEEVSWNDFRKQQLDKIKQQQAEQQQENKEFRETLKGLNPDAKMKAVIEHHKVRQEKNKTVQEQLHKEKMRFLDQRLASNKKLTEAQKAELKNTMEERYRENVVFRDKQRSENVDFFQKIVDDTTMNPEQKREALKKYLAMQQRENETYRKEQKNKLEQFKLESMPEENKSETPSPVTAERVKT